MRNPSFSSVVVGSLAAVMILAVGSLAHAAAPVLTSTGGQTMTSINEDNVTSAGQLVSAIVGTTISGGFKGVAVFSTFESDGCGSGTWQYKLLVGDAWTAFSAAATVDATQALLLPPTAYVRLLPDTWNGFPATFDYYAWDGSTGIAGGRGDVSGTLGGTTAFSLASDTATLVVSNLNDPPQLDPIAAQSGNELAPMSFIATGYDADCSDSIAFSLDGLPNTTAVGAGIAPSTGAFSWTPTEAQGPGSYVARVRVTDNGAGALSTYLDVTITVNEVNQAPVLTALASSLTAVDEDVLTGNNLGAQVLGLMSATDPDLLQVAGIAVSAVSSAVAGGGWQYRPNGQPTWVDFGAVSATSALLLIKTDWVRFMPNGTNGGTSTFSFYAWDGSSGVAGTSANVSTRGGATPYSVLSDTVSIAVTAANDAPVLTAPAAQNAFKAQPFVLTLAAADIDRPAQTLTFSIVSGAPSGALLSAAGVFTWTPSPAQVGKSFTVSVKVTDDGTPPLSDTKSFTISVAEPTYTPIAVGDLYGTGVDKPLVVADPGVLGNDSDQDVGDVLTAAIGVLPVFGTLVFTPTGGFTYTPSAGYKGNDSFTYTVSDTHGNLSDAATVSIAVGADGDVCTSPAAAVLGTDAKGSLAVLANDYSAESCAAAPLAGADAFWSITVPAPGKYKVTLTPKDAGADLALVEVSGCTPSVECVSVVNVTGPGQPEVLGPIDVAGTTLLVAVDAVVTPAVSDYTLRIEAVDTTTEPPPPGPAKGKSGLCAALPMNSVAVLGLGLGLVARLRRRRR